MKTEQRNNNNQELFTTLDAYLSGYLVLKGFQPTLLSAKGAEKIVFAFHSTPELFESINDYNSGAMVGALHLAVTIKGLKSRIHSIRRYDNEQRYYSSDSKT